VTDKSISEFLDLLASKSHTPGGGSVLLYAQAVLLPWSLWFQTYNREKGIYRG
jgi:hypothetical protein